jgi:hypothetical protein
MKKGFCIYYFLLLTVCCKANIYVAYYATINGNTGHIGIAIDNYDIKITDFYENGQLKSKEDTVANGTITYFDLWPATAVTKIWQIHTLYEPLYVKYPFSDFDEPYYLSDLYVKGIPKKKKKALDGLLQISSNAAHDFDFRIKIDSIIERNKGYNAVSYNCTDFVMNVLYFHFKHNIKLKKEYILYAGFYSPNRLFSYLMKQKNTILLLDPKNKTKGRFFKERFLKRIFGRKQMLDDKIQSIT